MDTKTKDDLTWRGMITLEDFTRKAIEDGREQDVIALIKSLPESKRQRYRDLWKQEKSKKRDGK